MIMILDLSNVITDFHEGYPHASILTGLFLLVLNPNSESLLKSTKTNDFGYYYH